MFWPIHKYWNVKWYYWDSQGSVKVVTFRLWRCFYWTQVSWSDLCVWLSQSKWVSKRRCVKLNWCDSGWWRYQLNNWWCQQRNPRWTILEPKQVLVSDLCNGRQLVAKIWTEGSLHFLAKFEILSQTAWDAEIHIFWSPCKSINFH